MKTTNTNKSNKTKNINKINEFQLNDNSHKNNFCFDLDTPINEKVNNNYKKSNLPISKYNVGWNYNSTINKDIIKKQSINNSLNSIENTDNYLNINDDTKISQDANEFLDKFNNDLFENEISFSDFELSKLLLKACSELNFFNPTKVQAKVIPLIIENNDVLVNAETGSGKTACYLLPILQKVLISKHKKLPIKVLILIPTRELAIQVSKMLSHLIKYVDNISYVVTTGGMSIESQTAELRKEPDIILATPGRLIDMIYNYKSINLDFINVLILDEADKLLELGFKNAIMEIVDKIGKSSMLKLIDDNKNKNYQHKSDISLSSKKLHQTLLFSATLNTNVISLGNIVLSNPIKLKLAHSNLLSNLKQSIVRMRFKNNKDNTNIVENKLKSNIENLNNGLENNELSLNESKNIDNFKLVNKNKKTKNNKKASSILNNLEFIQRASYLATIIEIYKVNRAIIFFNTKLDCHKAFLMLKHLGIYSEEIHSDIPQIERLTSLNNFQTGKTPLLLATDVLGRGIDIEKVKYVINFQMPIQGDRYIHRIGRTARKGNLGHAITICNDVDRSLFKKLHKKHEFILHPLKVDNKTIIKNYISLKNNSKEINLEYEDFIINKELDAEEIKINRAINIENNYYNIKSKPKK